MLAAMYGVCYANRNPMPKLSLSRSHSLPQQLVRERVGSMEEKLRAKYNAKTRWESDYVMRMEGPGVQGRLSIDSEHVVIELDLSFMLAPFKTKLEDGLSRELERLLTPETP